MIGEINYLERVDNVEKYIHKNEKAVICFDDFSNPCYYATYAASKMKKSISFGISAEKNAIYCEKTPCLVPFYRGSVLNSSGIAPKASIEFARWCKTAFSGSTRKAEHPEDLRKVIEGNNQVIFAVDSLNRPKYIPESETMYLTSSKAFKMLGVDVKKGFYKFNPNDRYLRQINSQNPYDGEIYVKGILDKSLYSRKYWAGFVLDTDNERDNADEMRIMDLLSRDFHDNISFAPIIGKDGADIVRKSKTIFFDIPMFIVFDTESNFERRWVIIDHNQAHNVTFIKNYLNRILNGEEPAKKISENELDHKGRRMLSINHDNFMDTIRNDNCDSVVLFTSKQCEVCLRLFLIVNKTANLLRQNDIKFYHLNASLNDIPVSIDSLPSLLFWKNGKENEAPYKFNGIEEVENIVDFVKAYSTIPIDVPIFDKQKIHNEITDEFYIHSDQPKGSFHVTKSDSN